MSNMTSASGEASASISSDNYTSPAKRKRNLPGNPDPDAEVVALSPNSLMATNRFVCQVCNKGFQRDQNLQLHRRGHNLPWKLRQRSGKESTKRVYICPETSCVHHNPSRALGDLTGIKKHFSRKHGEKKWKCDKCSKTYAVQSDWKAHSKTCGTREYRCDCGTLFSRRDSFITHRAFCDALAQEKATMNSSSPLGINPNISSDHSNPVDSFHPSQQQPKPSGLYDDTAPLQIPSLAGLWPFTSSSSMGSLYSSLFGSGSRGVQGNVNAMDLSSGMVGATNWPFPSNGGSEMSRSLPSMYAHHNNCRETGTANMSATALLQKAAQMSVKPTINSSIFSDSMERREGEKMSSAFVDSQMDSEKGNAGLLGMMKSCVGLGSFNAVQQGYNTLQTSIGENNIAASYGGLLESLAPSRNMNIGPPPSLPKHNTMLMQVENQKSNVKASGEVECEGVTRDFLGVGMRVVLNMGTQYRNMLE